MIIPTGFAQVNFIFGGGAQPTGGQVTLGTTVPGPPEFTPLSVAQQYYQFWEDTFLFRQSNEITLTGVLCKFGPNDTGPSALYLENQTGELSSPAVPPNTSALVSKVTDVGGRRGRGRMYIPGIPDSDVSGDGLLSSGALAGLETACTNFRNALETALFQLVLLHAPGQSAIPAPTNVVDLAGNQRVATQRRRLRR